MIELTKYATERNLPLVRIDSEHLPVKKEENLKLESGKLFRNIPSFLGLYPGTRLMITHNINPSVGLYNGARCTYIGSIYLPKQYTVKVEKKLPSVGLSSGVTR